MRMERKKVQDSIAKTVCLIIIVYCLIILPGHWNNYSVLNKTLDRKTKVVTVIPQNLQREREALELPQAFTFSAGKWKLTSLCKPHKNDSNYRLINYASKAGVVKIFAHSPSDGISSIIERNGAFEVGNINRVLYELHKNPKLNLIDIGTNLGQHCIAAALIGRSSIAIDAAEKNIQHVCASAHYLKFGQNITFIHNIVSDTNEKHEFRYSKQDTDHGSIHVNSDGIWDKMKKTYTNYFNDITVLQDSVMLDNLLSLPQIHRFKKVFIKIDVEGHEHRVLLGAKKLFNHLDVHGILMEWAWHVKRPSSEVIKDILTELKFKPFAFIKEKQFSLNLKKSDTWPQDVLWIPSKYL